MKNGLIILLIILTGCASTSQETSEKEAKQNHSANFNTPTKPDSASNYFIFSYIDSLKAEHYYRLLENVKNNLSADYFMLRMAFTKTDQYRPYDLDGRNVHREMRAYIETDAYHKVLAIADSILQENYVDVLTHLYCGYVYAQLSDTAQSRYHYRLYDGLIRSIYESGDGRGPSTAFIVLTVEEEYALLGWLGRRSIEQALVHENGYSFDIMKTVDDSTGQEFEMYFNISLPVSYLKAIIPNEMDKDSTDYH